MSISVRFDTKAFDDRLDLSSREVRNACRRAVDKAARTARRETIETMARDINTSKAAFRRAVPPVKASTQTSLSASWTISKARVLIAQTVGASLPVRGASGLTASTFALTGGGSASLNIPKAFTIRAGGNTLVMIRTGKGRAAIRAVYAESPATGMTQAGGAPRKKWEQIAARELNALLPAEVQRALDGQTGGTALGGGEL